MTRHLKRHRDDAAIRASRKVRSIRDEIEQAQRVPGDRLEITRQVSDEIIDALHIIDRALVTLAERA